jgi:transcriptional regulator with XRE-family HTH domain
MAVRRGERRIARRGMQMSLSERLFELRQTSGASLQTVADAVGASKAHIWELEKGRTANPSFELVQKLASYYGVTTETLIGEGTTPPAEDLQIQRIHRDLKELSPGDREVVEEMVRLLRARSGDRT